MRRRIATVAATMATLLLVPASALGAESASVSGGVLTYVAGDGTFDRVSLVPGSGSLIGLRETMSPEPWGLGAGCTIDYPASTAWCTGVTSATLSAGDRDDTVTVEPAVPASIDGGTGEDEITGGPAADTVEARDGEVDTIDCGGGTDTAYVDEDDVVTNCELPAPPPPDEEPTPDEPSDPVEPAGDDADDPDAPVESPDDAPAGDEPAPGNPIGPPAENTLAVLPTSLSSTVAKVSGAGVATFELACAATELAGCRGNMYLDPAPRAKKRRRAVMARRGRFGRSKFVIASGKKARVRVRLSAPARSALGMPRRSGSARASRRGRLRAVATVVQKARRPVRVAITLKR